MKTVLKYAKMLKHYENLKTTKTFKLETVLKYGATSKFCPKMKSARKILSTYIVLFFL